MKYLLEYYSYNNIGINAYMQVGAIYLWSYVYNIVRVCSSVETQASTEGEEEEDFMISVEDDSPAKTKAKIREPLLGSKLDPSISLHQDHAQHHQFTLLPYTSTLSASDQQNLKVKFYFGLILLHSSVFLLNCRPLMLLSQHSQLIEFDFLLTGDNFSLR